MIDREIIAVFHYDDKGSKCCGREPYRYAEEIVRCKECIFADVDVEAEMYRCGSVSFPHWNKGEHFCADGEREGER